MLKTMTEYRLVGGKIILCLLVLTHEVRRVNIDIKVLCTLVYDCDFAKCNETTIDKISIFSTYYYYNK